MKIVFIFMIISLLISICGYQNVIVKKYKIKSPKIHHPIRIGVISDLHGTRYGLHQETLIKMILKQDVDVIVMVGDLVDEYSGFDEIVDLLKGIKDIPCYYVLGNHEISSGKKETMIEFMNQYHVCLLGQKTNMIEIYDTKLLLGGMDDCFQYGEGKDYREYLEYFEEDVQQLSKQVNPDIYSILLSHRPSLTDIYQKTSFDLIISGHAHGGQWRIPYILNGLYAPDEGLFPRFAGGMYQLSHNQLLVGRGLVKNIIPRFFNPPEFVVIDMKNNES